MYVLKPFIEMCKNPVFIGLLFGHKLCLHNGITCNAVCKM